MPSLFLCLLGAMQGRVRQATPLVREARRRALLALQCPKVEVDEQAGYTIYKNRMVRSATIHRSWCRQVWRSGRFHSFWVKATGWYIDGLTTMEDAERAARTEG